MDKWKHQLHYSDVNLGDQLPEVVMPITLRRLVIEAGANRDFSSIHHENDAAIATGARGAYANTYFILGMIERTVREWVGMKGVIKKIGPMRMKSFTCVGDVFQLSGNVEAKIDETNTVVVDISGKTEQGETVTSKVTVELPN